MLMIRNVAWSMWTDSMRGGECEKRGAELRRGSEREEF